MLTGLPRDAHQALADVEAIDAGKGETYRYLEVLYNSYLYHSWLSLDLARTNSWSDVLLTLPSHRALPASPISPDSQEPGLQSERVAEIRDRGEISSQEVGL